MEANGEIAPPEFPGPVPSFWLRLLAARGFEKLGLAG